MTKGTKDEVLAGSAGKIAEPLPYIQMESKEITR